MSDLTKELLNKEIVKMRQCVRNARQQLIAKLLKTVKKLKAAESKNGERNAKKADKIMLEIANLKRINFDEVTKYALVNAKSLSQAIREGSVKDRAIARLADHKLMKNSVAAFRQKYPNWNVQVQSLFNIWAFQKKFAKLTSRDTKNMTTVTPTTMGTDKPHQMSKKPPENSRSIAREISTSEENDGGEEEIQRELSSLQSDEEMDTSCLLDVDCNVGGTPRDKSGTRSETTMESSPRVTASCEKVDVVTKRGKQKPNKKSKSRQKVAPKSVIGEPTTDIPSEDPVQVLQQKDEKKKGAIHKIRREMEVRQINLSAIEDGEILTEQVDVSEVKDTDDDTKHRVKSSFFLASDGEEQSSEDEDKIMKSDSKDDIRIKEDNRFRNDYVRGQFGQRRGGRFGTTTTGPRNRAERRKLLREETISKVLPEKPSVIQERLAKLCNQEYIQAHRAKSDNASYKLHPSWEAKKKLNEQKGIVAFQGKKITFDD